MSTRITWGKRGQVLSVLGLIFALLGIGYSSTDLNVSAASQLLLATEIAPIHFWGACWIAAGTIAIVTSFWPAMKDIWGYVSLTAMALWWAAVYGVGLLVFHAHGAYRGFLSWLMIVVLLEIISGWPDPPDSRIWTIGHGKHRKHKGDIGGDDHA